jgi:ABC-type transporter Mla MlaB component
LNLHDAQAVAANGVAATGGACLPETVFMSELLMHELPVKDRVLLGGPLTVRTIALVHERLLAALREFPSVTVDLSRAGEVDLSLIQLMLAARKSAAAAGKRLSLAAPVDGALRDALACAGLIASADDQPAADQAFWLNKETADGQDHPHRG